MPDLMPGGAVLSVRGRPIPAPVTPDTLAHVLSTAMSFIGVERTFGRSKRPRAERRGESR
jgi:hypothetical protein